MLLMKRIALALPLTMSLLLPPALASAQEQVPDSSGHHPFLSDRFHIDLGMFAPNKDINIRVDGSVPGEDIDLQDEVGASESESTFAIDFRWQFGRKWNFQAQAWSVDSAGRWELGEDLEWNDIVFKGQSFAEAGVDFDIVRAFLGRRIWQAPGQEFGLGIGLHWLEIGAFIAGQAFVESGDQTGETEFRRESVSAEAPLPNIGGWYMYSWSPRWVFQARTDWLSASIGDYSGGLLNVSGGVNYQPFEHVGFGLAYNYFRVDVDVEKSDWRGRIKTAQNGPFLSVNFTW
jgi:hypothetical protein